MKRVTCVQWAEGACALGLFGGRPSPGKCERCDRYEPTAGATARVVEGDAHVEPLPRDAWPILARIIARLRRDGETGVGDTIAAKLGKGGEWFKSAFHELTGKDCGCASRQAWCNARFPY